MFKREVIVLLILSLEAIEIGYVFSYTEPAAESILDDFQITMDELIWLKTLVILSASVGSIIAGFLVDFTGRKISIILTNLVFLIGWLVMGIATNVRTMYISRIISGLAVGLGCLVLLLYLTEISRPKIRGTLVFLAILSTDVGVSLCYAFGKFLKWRSLAWTGFVWATPFMLVVNFLPESPAWHIFKGKPESARKTLTWMRGENAEIEEEFATLIIFERDEQSNVFKFLHVRHLKLLLTLATLMIFVTTSGTNLVNYYKLVIFRMAEVTIEEEMCLLIVGIINVLATILAAILIDIIGRKFLLYISYGILSFTLGIFGLHFYMLNTWVGGIYQVLIINYALFICAFNLGCCYIPWLLTVELLPSEIRSLGASFVSSIGWLFVFFVSKKFDFFISITGTHGLFWIFSLSMLVALIVIVMLVPETNGRTLLDIQTKFNDSG